MASSRLFHSHGGYLRYMQMSSTDLFVFVEGKQSDPFVVGALCSAVCKDVSVSYQVVRASEILNTAGGKPDLLAFYEYLRRRQSLKSTLGVKTTRVCFFLDKDIDDILRRLRKSPHIIYSQCYDIQNDIFLHGRLLSAVAAASSLDPGQLAPHYGNGGAWCQNATQLWRQWVVLCVISAVLQINHQCNYGQVSQVQDNATGLCDAAKVAAMIAGIQAKSGFDAATFNRVAKRISGRVAKRYSSGTQDSIFKGKWYAALLNQELNRAFGANGYDSAGFTGKICAAMAATLNVNDPWATPYKDRIAAIIK